MSPEQAFSSQAKLAADHSSRGLISQDIEETYNSDMEDQKDNDPAATYMQLYGAAIDGDWETAKSIMDKDRNSLTAKIAGSGETVLHIAVRGSNSNSIRFVRELLKRMDEKTLEQTDGDGRTALYHAAAVGNTQVAKMLVRKNRNLPQAGRRFAALFGAATYGQEDTFRYILSVTNYKDPNSFTGIRRVVLLKNLTSFGHNDKVIDLLKMYPGLAQERQVQGSILDALSRKPFQLKSGIRGLVLHRGFTRGVYKKLTSPRDTKLKNNDALGLLKLLWHEVRWSYDERAAEILREPLFTAIRLGIHEFVKEIIKIHPAVALLLDKDGHNILEVAVLHRQDEVFDIICQMGLHKHFIGHTDDNGNNIMHLAGLPNISNPVSGAALHMQREMRWFKKVEHLVRQPIRESKNRGGKTPREVFTESHTELLKEGEEWAKSFARSGTIVAALITTVVFGAAIRFPGGTNDQGKPIFLYDDNFLYFYAADMLALCFSTISILVFLSVLVSRYAEEDFLWSVPRKLFIGFVCLVFSVQAMIMVFATVIQLVFLGSQRERLFIAASSAMAYVQIPVVILFQFPLAVELYHSAGLFEGFD